MERLTFQELQERPGTTKQIAEMSGISAGEVLLQLAELNERVRLQLGYKKDPITAIGSDTWKVDGVAGVLRLNSIVELEVVPKFLDPSNPTWRTDFFLLAVLAKTGHLFLHDEISAATQERGDLATLIAMSLLDSHAENRRRPIRGYRRRRRLDFSIDGDVDWETIFLPDADGFAVSGLELTRQNPYNATLAAAAQILSPEVPDADTQSQLVQLARQLSPQTGVPTTFPPLTPRHQSWQQAYDLARLVIEGLGLNLDDGSFSGPGFILSTWSAWESLCEELLRRALPDMSVEGQHEWLLGHRGTENIVVKPDISPMENGTAQFLLDAKYKTRLGRTPVINATDLYESLAFLQAAEADIMYLLYPAISSPSDLALGEWRRFDRITVDYMAVEGYEVQIQGLSQTGAFDRLVDGVRRALYGR
ncbi:hypothetical protein ACFORJ_01165 [Corynebacterium hansenii]|uniref:McrBC 5-methylcytosine restriction system component n=1 Tax=Corynebacterium hansenii TaxID=394964 RepID=A0ABV7ZL03_9CORY|nr:hypothetical protein [Corynebacterium hansenii]WJY99387.1 McrBC 5-methylcytosine restriction system component [Corynebacterium hansenii]